jgi:hypothetical protein
MSDNTSETVTQADRDIASAICEDQYPGLIEAAEAVRDGKADTHFMVQAFARYRTACTTPAPIQSTARGGKHPSHKTRSSDASTYDEVCLNCGATDIAGNGWGKLAEPCIATPAPSQHSELADNVAEMVARDVAELGDRTSPDDWPEAMLVTADELTIIVQNAVGNCSRLSSLRQPPSDAMAAENERLRTALCIIAGSANDTATIRKAQTALGHDDFTTAALTQGKPDV